MNNQPYIRVFTKPDCPFCVQAKDLLSAKGFSYSEFELGKDLTKEEFVEQFPKVKTVPYIIVGNNHVGGYKQLVEMLGEN
jgi:glutaredoxin